MNYPDGTPGFYFARLAYAPNLAEILAKDRQARQQLVSGEVTLNAEIVAIRHSQMDSGSLKDIFDADTRTLARFNASNPAVMELRFPRPRPIHSVALTLSGGNWEVNLTLVSAPGAEEHRYTTVSRNPVGDPKIEVSINQGPAKTSFLRVEIRAIGAGDSAIIHVRELELR